MEPGTHEYEYIRSLVLMNIEYILNTTVSFYERPHSATRDTLRSVGCTTEHCQCAMRYGFFASSFDRTRGRFFGGSP